MTTGWYDTKACQPPAPDPATYGYGWIDDAVTAYEAFIFDFDGTLVDTAGLNTCALLAGLRDAGVIVTRSWVQAMPLISLITLRQRVRADHEVAISMPDASLLAACERWWISHTDRLRLHPDMSSVVRSARGRLPLAVASANLKRLVITGLEVVHLRDAFQVVIAREDVSAVKPDPSAFVLAAEALGVETSACLVFEDSDRGMSAARAAGMVAWDVRRPRARPMVPHRRQITRATSRVQSVGSSDSRQSKKTR